MIVNTFSQHDGFGTNSGFFDHFRQGEESDEELLKRIGFVEYTEIGKQFSSYKIKVWKFMGDGVFTWHYFVEVGDFNFYEYIFCEYYGDLMEFLRKYLPTYKLMDQYS